MKDGSHSLPLSSSESLVLCVSSDLPELSPRLNWTVRERENPGLLHVGLNLGGSVQSEHGGRPKG